MITCSCKFINDSHWPLKSIPMSRLNYRFWWIRVPTHQSWVIWEWREQCWAMGELWSFEIFAPEKCFFCSLETRDSIWENVGCTRGFSFWPDTKFEAQSLVWVHACLMLFIEMYLEFWSSRFIQYSAAVVIVSKIFSH